VQEKSQYCEDPDNLKLISGGIDVSGLDTEVPAA